jgi:hypothetical protein
VITWTTSSADNTVAFLVAVIPQLSMPGRHHYLEISFVNHHHHSQLSLLHAALYVIVNAAQSAVRDLQHERSGRVADKA